MPQMAITNEVGWEACSVDDIPAASQNETEVLIVNFRVRDRQRSSRHHSSCILSLTLTLTLASTTPISQNCYPGRKMRAARDAGYSAAIYLSLSSTTIDIPGLEALCMW